MLKDNRILQVLLIVVIGVGVQFLFILLGKDAVHDSPNHGAVEFARAYFQKDPQMIDRISKSQQASVMNDVKNYIRNAAKEARSRGYDDRFMASMLYHLKTETQFTNDAKTEANVRITAKRKTAINPVYFLVAVVFNLGETHTIDNTLRMKKENGRWMVCEPFSTIVQQM